MALAGQLDWLSGAIASVVTRSHRATHVALLPTLAQRKSENPHAAENFYCQTSWPDYNATPCGGGALMKDPDCHEVTQILQEWNNGGDDARARLMPLVYGELRRLAQSYLRRERPDHTLQPTALVHEAYLRLVDQSRVEWQNRVHFYGVAAQMMRRILIDHARAHASEKRGGGRRLSLDEAAVLPEERAADLVALDDALKLLADTDERKSRVVELRFFGGLSVKETADALGLHTATVERDWRIAKMWLHRELSGEVEGDVEPGRNGDGG
jgi:RNA polymerase sigma factor (TIGR02999 family)